MAGYFKEEQHKLDIDDKFNDGLNIIEGLIRDLAKYAEENDEEVLSSAYQALAKVIKHDTNDTIIETVIENAKSRLEAQQSIAENLKTIHQAKGKALSEAEGKKAELLKKVILHTSKNIFEDTQEVLDEQERVLKTTLDPKQNLVNILGPAGSAKTVHGFFPILWATTNGKNVGFIAPDDRVEEARKDFEKKASKHIDGLFNLLEVEEGIKVTGRDLKKKVDSFGKQIDTIIDGSTADPEKYQRLKSYKEIFSALKSIASLDKEHRCIKFMGPNDYTSGREHYSSVLVDEAPLIEPEQFNAILVKVMRCKSRIITTSGPNQNSAHITPLLNQSALPEANLLVEQQLRNKGSLIANSLNDGGGIDALVQAIEDESNRQDSQFNLEGCYSNELQQQVAEAYTRQIDKEDDLLKLEKVALITASNNNEFNKKLEQEAVKSLKAKNILKEEIYTDSNGVPVYRNSVIRLNEDIDVPRNGTLTKGSRFIVASSSEKDLKLKNEKGRIYSIKKNVDICSSIALSSKASQGLTCNTVVVCAPDGKNGADLNGLYTASTRHKKECILFTDAKNGDTLKEAYRTKSHGSLSQDPDQLTATTNVNEEEKAKQQVEQQHARNNYNLWQSSEIQIDPDNSADQILETLNNIYQKGLADYQDSSNTKIIDITRGDETVIHSNNPHVSDNLEIANYTGVKAAQTAFKQSDVYSRELTSAQTKQVATAIEQFVVEGDGKGGSKLNADKATIAASMLLELLEVAPKLLNNKASNNDTENRHWQGSLQQAISIGLSNSLEKTLGKELLNDLRQEARDKCPYGFSQTKHEDLSDRHGIQKYIDANLVAYIAINQCDTKIATDKLSDIQNLLSYNTQNDEATVKALSKKIYPDEDPDYLLSSNLDILSKAYINFLENRVADRYDPKNPQGDDPLITDLGPVFKNVIHGANETTIVDPLEDFKQALKGGERDTILAEASKAHREKNQSIPDKDFYEPKNMAEFLRVNQDILHDPFAENQSSDDLWSVVDLLVAQKQKIAELENEVKTLQQQKKNRDESIGNLEEGLYDVKQELGNAQQRNSNLEEDNKKLIQAAQNSVDTAKEMIKTQEEQKKQFKQMKDFRNIAYVCAAVGFCAPLVGLALTVLLEAKIFVQVSIGVAMAFSLTAGILNAGTNQPAIKEAENDNTKTTEYAQHIDTGLTDAIETYASTIQNTQ
jgi:hypothetical protein